MRHLAFISLLVAGPVLADCPVPADMVNGGVRFSSPTGDVETFTREGDGIVFSTVESEDGPTVRAVLAKGLYVTEIHDIEPDGTKSNAVSYSFPTPLSNLPVPFPGGAFGFVAEGHDAEGIFNTKEMLEFGEVSVLMIQNCSFVMIPVTWSYEGSEDTDFYHFLPDYGLSYLAKSTKADGTVTDYSFSGVEGVE